MIFLTFYLGFLKHGLLTYTYMSPSLKTEQYMCGEISFVTQIRNSKKIIRWSNLFLLDK